MHTSGPDILCIKPDELRSISVTHEQETLIFLKPEDPKLKNANLNLWLGKLSRRLVGDFQMIIARTITCMYRNC